MLNGYPMVPGEFVQNPFPAKSPDAAVLLPAEWTGWRIVHTASGTNGEPQALLRLLFLMNKFESDVSAIAQHVPKLDIKIA